jgi:hypothetical protein
MALQPLRRTSVSPTAAHTQTPLERQQPWQHQSPHSPAQSSTEKCGAQGVGEGAVGANACAVGALEGGLVTAASGFDMGCPPSPAASPPPPQPGSLPRPSSPLQVASPGPTPAIGLRGRRQQASFKGEAASWASSVGAAETAASSCESPMRIHQSEGGTHTQWKYIYCARVPVAKQQRAPTGALLLSVCGPTHAALHFADTASDAGGPRQQQRQCTTHVEGDSSAHPAPPAHHQEWEFMITLTT